MRTLFNALLSNLVHSRKFFVAKPCAAHQAGSFLRLFQAVGEKGRPPLDGGRGIVEFVSKARGQPAERDHLFVMQVARSERAGAVEHSMDEDGRDLVALADHMTKIFPRNSENHSVFLRHRVAGGTYQVRVLVSDLCGGTAVLDGAVAVSDPLLTWRARVSGTGADLADIAAAPEVVVAVGADYNMLLVSRMRDESSHSVRYGIIRTLSSTGGVITAAGLIFAASMAGLMFSSIGMVVQGGFVIGVGILLDTFVVRTITVPAIAALVGRANWWPSRGPQRSKTPVPAGAGV